MAELPYRRILLKMSGEILAGDRGFGIDPVLVSNLAGQVKSVVQAGIQVGIVIGGGNFFRGEAMAESGMDRVTGDYLGMTATIMNSVAFQNALENIGLDTRVLSALTMVQLAEPYIRRRAIRHLEKGRVVLFAAGTGNPFMTTDTASALRALEIGAEVLLMAKNNVDGVYDSNPHENPDAVRFSELDYMDALNLRLDVMDSTAVSLCMDNKMPIIVFDVFQSGSMACILSGEPVGTIISGKE